jgi:hypothetical protein
MVDGNLGKGLNRKASKNQVRANTGKPRSGPAKILPTHVDFA